MLRNAYFNLLAKIGADTAENELHFAEILPIGRLRIDSRVIDTGRGALVRRPQERADGVPAAVAAARLRSPWLFV